MIKFIKDLTKTILIWAIVIFCWPYLIFDGYMHAEEYIGLSNVELGKVVLRRHGLDWLCSDEGS